MAIFSEDRGYRTLVKSAALEGNLELALSKFDPDIREVPAGYAEIKKYVLGKRVTPNQDVPPINYWMMLFQDQLVPVGNNNTLLTLTSLYDTTNQEIYRKLIETTGLEFKEAENPVDERWIQEQYKKMRPFMKLMRGIGPGIKKFPLIRTV
jgi:hypothetical protein